MQPETDNSARMPIASVVTQNRMVLTVNGVLSAVVLLLTLSLYAVHRDDAAWQARVPYTVRDLVLCCVCMCVCVCVLSHA